MHLLHYRGPQRPRKKSNERNWVQGEPRELWRAGIGTYEELRGAERVDDDGLRARHVHAHVAVHAAALETDEHAQVHRQPLRL